MKSYWIESTKNEKRNYPRFKENLSTEVCIIGGGITGITTAYYLAKEGREVILLEKDEMCSKTSGNTTAKITSQHGLFYKYLIDSEGKEFAKKYLEANEEAIRNIEKIIKEENINCDFEKQDAFVFTQRQEEVPKIQDEVNAVKSIGGDSEFVTKVQLPFSIQGAIKFKNQAQFNIRKYAFGLLNKVLETNNCSIFENTKVLEVNKGKEGYLVHTKNGDISAKYVVLATRYPIINSPGFYFFKMYQSKSYAIAIECENDDFFSGMYISSELPTKSFRTVVDGDKRLLLIVGFDHKTGKDVDCLKMEQNLEKYAKELYPNCEIRYKWSAEDCIGLDKIPYIGSFSKFMPNLYVGTGYKKWGITISNIAANIICDKIQNRENKYEEIFRATRVEPIKNIQEVENMLKQTIKSLIVEKFKIPKEDLEDIECDEGKIINVNGNKVGVYKDSEGRIYAVKPICSHLGCELSWNSLEHTWDCPCHGSRFDYLGNSIEVPSIDSLEQIQLEDYN